MIEVTLTNKYRSFEVKDSQSFLINKCQYFALSSDDQGVKVIQQNPGVESLQFNLTQVRSGRPECQFIHYYDKIDRIEI